ncbi:EF-hand calcium-binding domain-containing protein 12 [Holothuria leucospilota]|uniref:EF-hand calcium-binding domain-containing protein 12 n=1 Tax=Holothuria leucospilota TaxID=206669 RepID=A0A9Q1CLE9_HOLLE|nr:EF-hand calcium-binding domain-containing protein 12 [Holothuria leucospilota]
MVDVEWSDFGLKRLFNPESHEFLPIEDQLKLYKARDLHKSKVFATAKRIWGSTKVRNRVFIAPPMKDVVMKDVEVKLLSSPLKLAEAGHRERPTEERRILSEQEKMELHQKELNQKMEDYKKWLKYRMELRNGLEDMGNQEKWLQSKPDMTALEQKVLERIIKRKMEKLEKNDNQIVASLVVPSRSPQPDLVHDLPEAIKVIGQHLSQRRLRIVDLFTQADKDKSWTITRQEFRNCIKEAGIPISDVLLDELIDNLDKDANEEIDFREFVDGIKLYKLEERRNMSRADSKFDQARGSSHRTHAGSSHRLVPSERPSRVTSAISETSLYSSSTVSDSSYLSVPYIDITERRELAPDDMIEKRKRERHSAKGRRRRRDVDKVKTGNRFVDHHSIKSTLGEQTGEEVNHFREARLKDYYKLCKLCKEKDIKLTPLLLERALLYPGDKPHRRIRSKISLPGPGLLSSHFAAPPEPPEDPDADLDFEKVFYDENGEPIMEIKHSFPKAEDVKPNIELQNLPTGKAMIKSKINSWLTFEDYVRLTSHLGKRYVKLRETEAKTDPFWPGHLLDKIQLCMDDHSHQPTNSLFRTKQPSRRVYPGSHNHDRWWPVSEAGYVNPGDIESRKTYSIDWK